MRHDVPVLVGLLVNALLGMAALSVWSLVIRQLDLRRNDETGEVVATMGSSRGARRRWFLANWLLTMLGSAALMLLQQWNGRPRCFWGVPLGLVFGVLVLGIGRSGAAASITSYDEDTMKLARTAAVFGVATSGLCYLVLRLAST